MSADNAVVNIPLAKRGNIDAQLDAYKRNAAREERQLRKVLAFETKCLRERARAVVSSLPIERLAKGCKVAGTTPAQYRKWLMSQAHWQPSLILSVYGSEA